MKCELCMTWEKTNICIIFFVPALTDLSALPLAIPCDNKLYSPKFFDLQLRCDDFLNDFQPKLALVLTTSASHSPSIVLLETLQRQSHRI